MWAALALVAAAATAGAAIAGPANGCSLSCWQSGAPTTQILAGNDFEIRGSGLRPGLPVTVCIANDYCRLAEVDATGSFSQVRRLDVPGSYALIVSQARNRQLESWVPRGTSQINVIP
jgi:hypothetical protein